MYPQCIYEFIAKEYSDFDIKTNNLNVPLSMGCSISINIYLYPVPRKKIQRFFSNITGLPERRNKRKSVLEITKMYYFKI